jgi:dTDP-glucose 4,6-dehydratase
VSPHSPRSVLITGAAGFIGSHLVDQLLADPSLRLVGLDKLTYAGRRSNLEGADPERFTLVVGDITDGALVRDTLRQHAIDTVIHLAAESHVDRSIDGPAAFIQTNVVGTGVLLEQARAEWGDRSDVRFHHVSTDEVYGSLGATGAFAEDHRYDPSSPYSATKAASDHLVRAWHRTYGLPITISTCSNNYGPRQCAEKLIPLMVARALRGEPLPVYGDGQQVRDWLHVADHCAAIEAVVRHGELGRTYNVGGGAERSNLELVGALCDRVDRAVPEGAPRRRLITFVADRPGHDRRYALDTAVIQRELGWRPRRTLDEGLTETVRWLLDQADQEEIEERLVRRGLPSGGVPGV